MYRLSLFILNVLKINMAIHQVSSGVTRPRYGHLSTPDPSWAAVAEQQKIFDENAKKMYDLPIEQFRKVPYKPSDLPQNAPVEGKDILIREIYVKVRDGSEVLARIYQPVDISSDHVLFFNTHGGGIVFPSQSILGLRYGYT